MGENSYFLDTSVFLNWILKRSKEAEFVLSDRNIKKYTNKYVLKEIYWVLKINKEFSEESIARYIERINEKCIILPTPSKEEFGKIDITDKSDRPIVFSAMKHNLILLIDDERTYRDAKKYVKVRRIPKD